MFYYAPGPLLWVTPLSAFPTPVPATATYYTVPAYDVPPAAPVAPVAYGAPLTYSTPMVYPPSLYTIPEISPPRGEYRVGRCLMICQ